VPDETELAIEVHFCHANPRLVVSAG